MTAIGMSAFWDFEVALTRHYLGSDGPEGSAPLEFLDASAHRLAIATGRPEDLVVDEFLGVFTRPGLVDALSHGKGARPPMNLQVPGYFNYLVLSCYVASVSSAIAESGQFHRRLQSVLSLKQGISSLSGLATLWRKLRDWCAARHESGCDIRKVVLPAPGFMTRIGYSVRISFPSRHDLGRMDRLFGDVLKRSDVSPLSIISWVRQELARHSWSQGFLRAFGDFERRHQAGERLLADHPFWLGLVGMPRAVHEASKAGPEFSLECATDLDGQVSYFLTLVEATAPDTLDLAPAGKPEEGSVTLRVTLLQVLAALATRRLGIPRQLLDRYADGVIPFSERGWGLWRAEYRPSGAAVRLLVRDGVFSDIRRDVSAEGWTLLKPMALAEAERLLRRNGRVEPVGDTVARLTVHGGIRLGRAYLGRPRYLPSITAVLGCRATTSPVGEVSGELDTATEGAEVRLSCREPIAGVWRVPVTEVGVTRSAPILVFERDAPETELVDPDALSHGWRSDEPPVQNVSDVEVRPSDASPSTNAEPPPEFADLLEALYGGGARGWEEKRLLPIVSAALPTGSTASTAWDVLRLCADSGWLTPRASRSWRARRWFLVPPRLVRYPGTSQVVLDGAASAAVRRRFMDSVVELGGKVSTRSPAGHWYVPTDVAEVPEPEILARMMRLTLALAKVPLPRPDRAIAFEHSNLTDRFRTIASKWDWSEGRFTNVTTGDSEDVVLERLATIKPNATDLYRITGRRGTEALLDGRSASIILACRLAGRPMFEFGGATVTRVIREGGLARELARYLRLTARCGPSLTFEAGGLVDYSYPCSSEDARLLSALLGAALAIGTTDPVEVGPLVTTVMTRLRGRAGAVVAARQWATAC